MKIKKIFRLIPLMILATPSLVNAATIDVICPESVKENTDFVCNIRGVYDENISSIIVKYRYSNELTYKNIELKDNWQFMLEDNPNATKFAIENEIEKTGDISLADITFNATNAAGKDLYIEFYDFDGTNKNAQVINYSTDSVRKNIHVKSKNNNLKTLLIDNEPIELLENVTDYTYTTTKDKVNISATLSDLSATCENLNREVVLDNDTKEVLYRVYSEEGRLREYKITISKEIENQVNDNNIENQNNNQTESNYENKTSIVNTGDTIYISLGIFMTSLSILLVILSSIKKSKQKKITD